MSAAAQQLLATPLGSLLSPAEAQDLAAAAKIRTLGPKQHLVQAGERGDALYIILTGALDVVLGHGAGASVVATLGPGQIAGELEIMTGSSRVASLLATEDTTVLEIDAAAFDAMLAQCRPAATKLVHTIAKALARRLAAVNQRIMAKAAAAVPAAPVEEIAEPVEIEEADVMPVIADDDLDVLDKLWS